MKGALVSDGEARNRVVPSGVFKNIGGTGGGFGNGPDHREGEGHHIRNDRARRHGLSSLSPCENGQAG